MAVVWLVVLLLGLAGVLLGPMLVRRRTLKGIVLPLVFMSVGAVAAFFGLMEVLDSGNGVLLFIAIVGALTVMIAGREGLHHPRSSREHPRIALPGDRSGDHRPPWERG